MRTIDPILKSACMTGTGIPIASAVVISLASTPLPDQSFDVVKYETHGEEMTATIRGSETPNYGKIIISRGYEVGQMQYLEPLPIYYIQKVIEENTGEFSIKANAFPSSTVGSEVGGSYTGTLANTITEMGNDCGIIITTPEEGSANSIFDANVSLTWTDAQPRELKHLLHQLGPWPLVRFYMKETSIEAIATTTDIPNITQIAVTQKKNIKFYDPIHPAYLLSGVGSWGCPYLTSTNMDLAFGGNIHPIYYNPTGKVPNIQTYLSKYYNEREYAASFFLLADMELEEGDRFEYEAYTWRIESISETFKPNDFTQSLFCLRIMPPDYLLLEIGDNILLESGDNLLME